MQLQRWQRWGDIFFASVIITLTVGLMILFYHRHTRIRRIRIGKPIEVPAFPSAGTTSTPNFLARCHQGSQHQAYQVPPLVKVHLSVKPPALAKWKKIYAQLMRQQIMTRDLQIWLPATFREQDYCQPVRFRLRGDLGSHWYNPRYSSIRVKFPRDKPWRHMRAVHFIAFHDKCGAIDLLVNTLARQHGLITYRMGMARLQMNDWDPQAYAVVEAFSEEMLAFNRRPVSAIFSLDDRWLRAKYMYPGLAPRHLPLLHIRNRLGRHAAPVCWRNLEQLLQLAGTQPANEAQKAHLARRFAQLVELKSYWPFCALSVLFNSQHLHNLQNMKWYADPTSGKFLPIHWDTLISPVRPDDPLFRGLAPARWLLQTSDQAYCDYCKSLYRLVTTASPGLAFYDACCRTMLQALPEQQRRLRPYFEKYRVLLEQRYAMLGRTLRSPFIFAAVRALDARRLRITLGAEGYAPVLLQQVQILNLPVGQVQVRAVSGEQTSQLLQTDAQGLLQWPLQRLLIPGRNNIRPQDHTLEFILEFSQPPQHLNARSFYLQARNLLDKQELGAQQQLVQYLGPAPCAAVLRLQDWPGHRRWRIDQQKRTIDVPAGEYRLTHTILCPAGYHLRIQAGARLLLGAGVWLLVQGDCTIRGQAQAPVICTALHEQPWGGVSIVGPARVHCRYLRLSKASGGAVYQLNPTGVLSLHEVQAVITHCSFSQLTAEDAINVVRGQIKMEACRFEHTRSDAVDLDWSRGTIRACHFAHIGGDALDLNASRVRLHSCTVEHAVDKGISLGEGSCCCVAHCSLRGCDIGIAVKDGTQARVGFTTISHCRIGVSAYRKKPCYAGGEALVEYCCFRDNRFDLGVDRYSHIQRRQSVGASRYLGPQAAIDDRLTNSAKVPSAPPKLERQYQ